MGSAHAVDAQAFHQKDIPLPFFLGHAPAVFGAGIVMVDAFGLDRRVVDTKFKPIRYTDVPEAHALHNTLSRTTHLHRMQVRVFRIP